MSAFETWYRNLGEGFPREDYLRRDLALVGFLSESFCLPADRLTPLVEEVADWRVEEHWLSHEGEKLRWARKAMETGDINPQEGQQLEADLAKREREYEVRMRSHEEEARRIFGWQPRIYSKEIFAAARAMAANEKAEAMAQRQNQHEVLSEVRQTIDAALDELLALGVSLDEIEELRNG